MRFHHIGIACRNINEEIAEIAKIHFIQKQSKIVFDKKQHANLCMLIIADGLKIELVAGKQVETILKNRQNYYHICYEVDDINVEIERLEKGGAYLLSPPKPAVLFNNRNVAFLKTSYGIIELLNAK